MRRPGRIGALGLQHVVTLHGPQDGTAVPDSLARGRLFLLPSVRVQGDAEGQELVVREAPACGLPVIARALPAGRARAGPIKRRAVQDQAGARWQERLAMPERGRDAPGA